MATKTMDEDITRKAIKLYLKAHYCYITVQLNGGFQREVVGTLELFLWTTSHRTSLSDPPYGPLTAAYPSKHH